MRTLLAVALFVGVASAAPVPKAVKQKDETALLVGRWKGADPTSHSFEYRADGTMKVWNGENDSGAAEYRWTLDPAASPKRMTWYDRNGDPPRPAFECVYELDGDELKISYESAPRVPAAINEGSQQHRMTRTATAK